MIQGGTTTFNLTISEADIAPQRAADPAAAAAEWDGQFRDDLSAYLHDDLIEAAVDYDRPLELPRRHGVPYKAFTDSAGGVGADAYTVCIAHREGAGDTARFVVDVVRGTSGRFDPQQTTHDFAALLRSYGITSVSGDRYSAEWVSSAWRHAAISYKQADVPKSGIYLAVLPLFAARGKIVLPNHPTLLRELRLLERSTHRGSRESVDHPRGGHDDYANAVCGALRECAAYHNQPLDYSGWTDTAPDDNRSYGERWHMARAAWYYNGMRPPF